MADQSWKNDQREREAQKRFQENKTKIEQKAALNWMYDQNHANAEEYLKGKKIDSRMLVDNEDIAKANALKIFQNTDVNHDNEAFVKFHEDPLTIIKREEMNQRKQVMTNPLQLKQIQQEIDDLKRGRKKKSKKDKKKKSKKRKRSKSSSSSDKSDSDSEYERRQRKKLKKQEEKQRRKEEKLQRKRQKIKEEEEERRRKEIELLGPDPELYKDRTAKIEEQEKLRTGRVDDFSKEKKKLNKEELAQKALEMQARAEQLDKYREDRYNTVLKIEDKREDKNVEKGMQPRFINDISKAAYVDHNMDLAESINRKKHYNERIIER